MKDPIERFAKVLLDRGVANEARLTEIRDDVVARFKSAALAAKREPLPEVSDLTSDVFAE